MSEPIGYVRAARAADRARQESSLRSAGAKLIVEDLAVDGSPGFWPGLIDLLRLAERSDVLVTSIDRLGRSSAEIASVVAWIRSTGSKVQIVGEMSQRCSSDELLDLLISLPRPRPHEL